MAQWLRICLPMQGTRVQALVWEDPICRGATRPQLLSLHVWSLCSATREATIVRGPRTTMKSGPRLPQLEKALAQKRRPNTAKNKINKLKKKTQGPTQDLLDQNLHFQEISGLFVCTLNFKEHCSTVCSTESFYFSYWSKSAENMDHWPGWNNTLRIQLCTSHNKI